LERLQKVIAHAGIASRRKAEELILSGNVQVNGKVVTELGIKVDPAKDIIRVNGKEVAIEEKKITILLNKPTKVITSMTDPQGRTTVIDLLDLKQRVYPVGRLDYDTEGLLLLTNDGELANRLMHPSYEIDKTYEVIIKGIPADSQLDRLRKGIRLEDGITSPAIVKRLEQKNHQTKIHITIHEGRNRQVRKMFEAIHFPVIRLKRIRYGFLTLKGVLPGNYRLLTEEESCRLRKLVDLNCI